jgi:hypothetical protein
MIPVCGWGLVALALAQAPGGTTAAEPIPPEAADPAAATPSRRSTRPARAPALDPGTLRALAASDPPIDALRAAASALSLAEPARARSLVERARLAGWLPEVRLRVDRRLARAESVDLGPSPTTPLAPVDIDSDNDVRYEARLSWDLSKIVFNPDEIAAQFQALRTADARRELESLVIHLYFERRRLKAESAASDSNDIATGMKLDVRIAEIEAELDALTGGAFTRLGRRQVGASAAAADP